MNVPSRVDFALRATIVLAESPETLLSRGEIARLQRIPAPVLTDILVAMKRRGLIANTLGPNGGYRLARPPASITLGDIVRAVDGPLALIGDRHPGDLSYAGPTAALRTVWLAVRGSLADVLDNVTLEHVQRRQLPQRIVDIATEYGLDER